MISLKNCVPSRPIRAPQFLLDVKLKRIVDRAGMHGVDPDVAAGEFLGQHAHQSDLGVLGGDVAIHAGVAVYAGDARRDDDRTAVVHLRHRMLGAEESASDMHGKDGVEHVFRIVGDRRDGAEIAGIAEQDVDFAEPRDGLAIAFLTRSDLVMSAAHQADAAADVSRHLRQGGLLRSTSITFAPCLGKSFADAAPMLPAPPVITQTLFCMCVATGSPPSSAAGNLTRWRQSCAIGDAHRAARILDRGMMPPPRRLSGIFADRWQLEVRRQAGVSTTSSPSRGYGIGHMFQAGR